MNRRRPDDPTRRRYLAALLASGVAGLAGCTTADDAGAPTTEGGPTGTPTDGGSGSDGGATGDGGGDGTGGDGAGVSGSPGDLDLPIEKSKLARGAAKDSIPAIVDPAFGADWSDTEFELADGDEVIGVERAGRARAYPLRILDWHEIVNDDFDGPLLVTFCPLCGSGMTAVRRVNGEPTNFGVSGYLYQSDLVMYDEATESLWSQIVATAINGPKTGTELTLVPSTITTWGTWHADHPDTEVLLPPPASGTIVQSRPRHYDVEPYRNYDESGRIGIGRNDLDDNRLHPKTQVIGVATGGEARAYPYETVVQEGVINDRVGDLPVVVAAGPDGTLVAYDRRLDGETLTFEPGDDRHMRAGGSRWLVTTGRAIDGPHEGARLAQASAATTMFWFAWVDFHNGTSIYGRGQKATEWTTSDPTIP